MLVVKYYDYDAAKDLWEIRVETCLKVYSSERGLILETNIGDVHNIAIPIPATRIISISVKE